MTEPGRSATSDAPATDQSAASREASGPRREANERATAARKVPAIVGPTASGKTFAAFALAQEFEIEIVTADSMQVYRGLDVGTAKPSLEEQRLIPHHLIDVVSPEERFTVARFVRLAEEAIAEVFARGATPLVAGGTGFYLRALREGVPTAPEADPERQAPIW